MEEADGEVLAGRGGREDMLGRDPPEKRVPAVALGKDVGQMLEGDGKKDTETSFKPHSFNVGHSNIAFFFL